MRDLALAALLCTGVACSAGPEAPPMRPGEADCVVNLETSMSRGVAVIQGEWAYVGFAGQVEFVARDDGAHFVTGDSTPRPIGRMFKADALLLPKGRQKQDLVDVSKYSARVHAFHETRTYAAREGCSPRQFAMGIAGVEHYLLMELVSNEDEE